MVVIAGENTEPTLWNGTVTIWNVQATSFQYTMSAAPFYPNGSGAITAAKVTGTRFDEVMAGIAASTALSAMLILLGPNPFGNSYLTAGYTEGGSNPWQIKARMKLAGSGREVTVIKRINAAAGGYVLGHDLTTAVDHFELSDLTLDCNLTGAAPTGATTGAVRAMGDHVRLSRVRAKAWGCAASNGTCQVFALILANPPAVPMVSNCGMEGCIADAPAKLTGTPANAGTVTMFHAGASSVPTGAQAEGYALSPYIRNCFGQWDVTITGTQARGLSMNWCRGGVVEGNHIYDADYGGPYPGSGTTLDLIVRNNFFKNVKHGMNWPQGGFVPSSPISITTIAKDTVDNTMAKVVTGAAHNFQVGERVKVTPTDTNASAFTGYFVVAAIDAADDKVFKFRLPVSNPNNPTPTTGTVQKVFSVGRVIIEGNIIELRQGISNQRAIQASDNASSAPAYDYVYGDVIIRNNKLRYVDGATPTDSGATLIEVQGVKNVIIQNNVLDTIATAPLTDARCANATYFNNRTPAGVLVQGKNNDSGRKYDELETDAEDAFVMGFIKRA